MEQTHSPYEGSLPYSNPSYGLHVQIGNTTASFNNHKVSSINPYELEKVIPCEEMERNLEQAVKPFEWRLVKRNVTTLVISRSLKAPRNAPLWLSATDEMLKSAGTSQKTTQIISDRILGALSHFLSNKKYFLDVQYINKEELQLNWLKAEFVGQHLFNCLACRMDSLKMLLDEHEEARTLYAEVNEAVFSNSKSENIMLYTGRLIVCSALVIFDDFSKTALMIHLNTGLINERNINYAIDLFFHLSPNSTSAKSIIVGGTTCSIGSPYGFHKTFHPALTSRGIEIIETFIGNPQDRPRNIIFSPNESKLYSVDISEDTASQLLSEHELRYRGNEEFSRAFKTYTSKNDNFLIRIRLTNQSSRPPSAAAD